MKITGRDPLTIAQKWEKGWEGQVRGKVILISDHPPDLGDPILPTRFNKIRFKQSFLGREDNDLQEKKLRPELPGIAVRCLAAYRRLKERGRFIQPKSAVWLEEEVSVNSNPFAAFVARNVVKEDGADALCKSVYERFEAWCRENGQIDTLKSTPRNHLTRRLNGEGGLTGLNIRRPNGEPRRYVGIRLRTMKNFARSLMPMIDRGSNRLIRMIRLLPHEYMNSGHGSQRRGNLVIFLDFHADQEDQEDHADQQMVSSRLLKKSIYLVISMRRCDSVGQ